MTEDVHGMEETLGVVTFLDVLGWKGIWRRRSDAIGDLRNVVAGMRRHAQQLTRGLAPSAQGPSAQTGTPMETKVVIISDTIVLLTSADRQTATQGIEIHGAICGRALPASLEGGIPLRGATAYGEYRIDRQESTFVGRAIDEAAEWYEQADWIGVFMTPSAAYSFAEDGSSWWRQYMPPVKEGVQWPTYCVQWPEEVDVGEGNIAEVKRHMRQMSPIVPKLVSKFTNTIKFVEKMNEEGLKRYREKSEALRQKQENRVSEQTGGSRSAG